MIWGYAASAGRRRITRQGAYQDETVVVFWMAVTAAGV